MRLAERFGSRWRIPKYRASPAGAHGVKLHESARPRRLKVRRRRRRGGTGGGNGGTGGTGGRYKTGTIPGDTRAEKKMVAGGVPSYKLVKGSDLENGMIAAWSPNEPGYPEGAVLINVELAVLRAQVEHFQAQYADHLAEEIEADVLGAYGEIAVSKVAHSEHLRHLVASSVIEEEFRSTAALTMSLLGLIAEEAVVAPRLGGRYKKRGRVE